MMSEALLIELRTEELPPVELKKLSDSFAQLIADGLKQEGFISSSEYQAFASPRRLAVLVQDVIGIQQDSLVFKKGPSVAAGMQDGLPSKALLGFARSNQVEVNDLKQMHDGKQDIFAYEYTKKGQNLSTCLSDIVSQAIKKLPIAKLMHWGSSNYAFVRPVHGLVMMHGSQLVDGEVLGLKSQNWTLGHRFLSTDPIVFNQATDYAQQLEKQGYVVADFVQRKAVIEQSLTQAAEQLHAKIEANEALLDEVTALVEWPVVLEAKFDERFLNVPQECLILTMQQNQKYFPLLDSNNKLINRFLLVSNLQTHDPKNIIQGNERVLQARLSDADFFFSQDKKTTLLSRVPNLQKVVYQHQLGSQFDRVVRIQALVQKVAMALSIDTELPMRAAELSKSDLLTEMVGEFPELQGTMGKYYALNDGESEVVAQAIESHYWPRFAGDKLPEDLVSTSLALADKLETLTGIWGIGLIPTGDKDPYALRRSALGILRMLVQHDLNIRSMLDYAYAIFPAGLLADNTVEELEKFMLARLEVWLQSQYPQDEVAAVLANELGGLGNLFLRLEAVSHFKKLPEASDLSIANKRVKNLLKKENASYTTSIDEHLFIEPAEKNLYQSIQVLQPKMNQLVQSQKFQEALAALAEIKPMVDDFFENVMVMDQNEQVKFNRLALLRSLAQELNAVADIALLD